MTDVEEAVKETVTRMTDPAVLLEELLAVIAQGSRNGRPSPQAGTLEDRTRAAILMIEMRNTSAAARRTQRGKRLKRTI